MVKEEERRSIGQGMSTLRKAVDFAQFASRKLYPSIVRVRHPMQIHLDDALVKIMKQNDAFHGRSIDLANIILIRRATARIQHR